MFFLPLVCQRRCCRRRRLIAAATITNTVDGAAAVFDAGATAIFLANLHNFICWNHRTRQIFIFANSQLQHYKNSSFMTLD